MAAAGVLILLGAGCTLPFGKKTGGAPIGDDGVKSDAAGTSLSEQADIILDAATEEADFDAETSGNAEADAVLFTSNEDDLDNLDDTYVENEL